MDFVAAIKSGFRNYGNFRGTATRSEYWYWVLFIALAAIALSILESALWPMANYTMMPGQFGPEWSMGMQGIQGMQGNSPLSDIFGLGIIVPTLAVTARRFHDAGFSAKWLWLQAGSVLLVAAGMAGFVSYLVANQGMHYYASQEQIFLMYALTMLQVMAPALIYGLGYAVFQLIVTVRPSKSAADGNKYAAVTAAENTDIAAAVTAPTATAPEPAASATESEAPATAPKARKAAPKKRAAADDAPSE